MLGKSHEWDFRLGRGGLPPCPWRPDVPALCYEFVIGRLGRPIRASISDPGQPATRSCPSGDAESAMR